MTIKVTKAIHKGLQSHEHQLELEVQEDQDRPFVDNLGSKGYGTIRTTIHCWKYGTVPVLPDEVVNFWKEKKNHQKHF